MLGDDFNNFSVCLIPFNKHFIISYHMKVAKHKRHPLDCVQGKAYEWVQEEDPQHPSAAGRHQTNSLLTTSSWF